MSTTDGSHFAIRSVNGNSNGRVATAFGSDEFAVVGGTFPGTEPGGIGDAGTIGVAPATLIAAGGVPGFVPAADALTTGIGDKEASPVGVTVAELAPAAGIVPIGVAAPGYGIIPFGAPPAIGAGLRVPITACGQATRPRPRTEYCQVRIVSAIRANLLGEVGYSPTLRLAGADFYR